MRMRFTYLTISIDADPCKEGRRYLLIRRYRRTGELAFHSWLVPGDQLCTKARLIKAAEPRGGRTVMLTTTQPSRCC